MTLLIIHHMSNTFWGKGLFGSSGFILRVTPYSELNCVLYNNLIFTTISQDIVTHFKAEEN